MSWQLALTAPLEQDLSSFCRLLAEQQIGHQVSEVQGEQHLWVADRATAGHVAELYSAWQQLPPEQLQFSPAPVAARAGLGAGWKQQLLRYPLTALVLLLTLLVAAWTGVGGNLFKVAGLTFNAVQISGDQAWFCRWMKRWQWAVVAVMVADADPLWLVAPGHEQHVVLGAGPAHRAASGQSVFGRFVLLAGLVSNASQFVMSGPSFLAACRACSMPCSVLLDSSKAVPGTCLCSAQRRGRHDAGVAGGVSAGYCQRPGLWPDCQCRAR